MNKEAKCVRCGSGYVRTIKQQKSCPACLAGPTWVDRQRERRRAEAAAKRGYRSAIHWFNVCECCTKPVEGRLTFCSPECRRAVPSPRERICARCHLPWQPTDGPLASVATVCWMCRHVPGGKTYRSLKNYRKAQLLRRECGRCQDCGCTADESGEPLHAHHIVPQALGGKHTLDNLRLLCADCHNGSGWHRNHAHLVQAGIIVPPPGQLAIAA